MQPLKLFIVTEALNFKSGSALVQEVQDMYFKKQLELDNEQQESEDQSKDRRLILLLPIFAILSAQNQINEIPSSEDSSEDGHIYRLKENPVSIENLTLLIARAEL